MSLTNRKTTSKTKKTLSNNLLFNSNIITTPCEKVLSILKQIKKFILKISKEQTKLIQNLDWCIKIITSRSLYSYELKDKEAINELSKENPEFKQLAEFVSEYNEKVIKMDRKYSSILTDKLLERSSTKLNKRKIERKTSFEENKLEYEKLLPLKEKNKKNKNEKLNSNSQNKEIRPLRKRSMQTSIFTFNKNTNTIHLNSNGKYLMHEISNRFNNSYIKKRNTIKKIKKHLININDDVNTDYTNDSKERILSPNTSRIKNIISDSSVSVPQKNTKNNNKMENKIIFSYNKNSLNKKIKNKIENFPSIQKISINISDDNNNEKDIIDYIKINKKAPRKLNTFNAVSFPSKDFNESSNINEKLNKTFSKSKKNLPHIIKEYSYEIFQKKLIHEGYDISKLITIKNFNIFELKELIGYKNVLPIMGRTILDNLGLLDEDILNISKLDKFLVSVSKQYKRETLYHNALHGTDVAHSVYIFFTHSNAEKVAKTNILDLLSIIIAALGHDIGHPGLTNTYHINDSTDMAIIYNDISVLENFHASTMFKTIRRNDNNIFDKLTTIDYKIIRKKMISVILATDMANHGKVMSLFKSKISLNEENNEYKLNLLSGNDQTKNEEKQVLLDFMLHLADLAHNTKLFEISKKWVELLSEEFWLQGDLEKENNLPVSFLCDRNDINIPKSQKGFISGFVIPTFECLVSVFPTLKFTLDNAKINLKEWQELLEQGRLRGWTPTKKEEFTSEFLM